jgi:hypothetical protein
MILVFDLIFKTQSRHKFACDGQSNQAHIA